MFNRKKRHFKAIKADAERLLWEGEFAKFQVLKMREQLRRQYDQTQQALEAIAARVKADPKNKKAEEDKLTIEKQADGLKDQLDAIDTRINGGPPCALIPNGVEVGMDEDLQNKADRIASVDEFIKYNT